MAALVSEYTKLHAPHAAHEAEFFRAMPSIELTIHHAAFAIGENGRCFDHQFRIKRSARPEAKRRLTAATARMRACRTFDGLHSLLLDLLSDIFGLGELYVYDTARQIGNYLGLSPTRVYLHRGAREGATALGLDTSRGVLEIDELPGDLRVLPAHALENFLCIFRKRFGRRSSF